MVAAVFVGAKGYGGFSGEVGDWWIDFAGRYGGGVWSVIEIICESLIC